MPYVRDKDAVQQQRMDRTAWKRKLADLLQATDAQLIRLLREDRLLHDWTGKTCPRCGKGTLSKPQLMLGTGMPRHRCSCKGCQAYINPHHLHPIFVDGRGTGATPLQTQSALLFLLLNGISHPAIHRILHINHKAIEDMENRLSRLRKRWVEEKEKSIVFGNGKTWTDIEADEATFTNTDLKDLADNLAQPIIWEQWCGIVQRGAPHTLVLTRLTPQTSAWRAPGPGAIRKVEWKPLATKHLRDSRCRPSHRCGQVLQIEDEWCPARPCPTLQKACQSQWQIGVEIAHVCLHHYTQGSEDRSQIQDQRGDANCRPCLALPQRLDSFKSTLPGWDLFVASEDLQCSI